MNYTLQSALVPVSVSSALDGDGGAEYGLDDGSVDVHHHCPWQLELRQLLQEVHRGKNAALKGIGYDGHRVREMFPQLHMLLPVKQDC